MRSSTSAANTWSAPAARLLTPHELPRVLAQNLVDRGANPGRGRCIPQVPVAGDPDPHHESPGPIRRRYSVAPA
jgi:hypothetical protein